MDHVGIGNRQDDAGPAGAELAIQFVLEVDHVRRAIRPRLVVHAMVGGDADDGSQRRQTPERIVQPRVEIVDLRRAGRVLVLDVVG